MNSSETTRRVLMVLVTLAGLGAIAFFAALAGGLSLATVGQVLWVMLLVLAGLAAGSILVIVLQLGPIIISVGLIAALTVAALSPLILLIVAIVAISKALSKRRRPNNGSS